MSKSPDAFRTISEVAEWLGVQAHVLRFWESKFSQVKPVKRAGGRRYYRPNDMLLLGGIKKLLHEDGMTIKGAQKMLREQGVAAVAAMSHPVDDGLDSSDFVEAETDIEIDIDVPAEPVEGMVVPFPKSQATAADSPSRPVPEDADSLLSRMEAQDAPAEDALPDTTEPDAGEDELAPLSARDIDAPPAADIDGADADDDFQEFGLGSATAETPDSVAVTADSVEQPADPALAVSEPEDDTAALPSFLNRRLTPESDAPASGDELDVERAASKASPKPIIIDAPDPPSDDQIAYVPGPLARLAAEAPIAPEHLPEVAAVLADLRAWHQRATSVAGR
jgi:DNA-binding transcriptional MerR regulator|tara:strand:+ start:1282 stop:2289 length:1008 start_codon:yes stop_codon:yes gene_type:complete